LYRNAKIIETFIGAG